MSDCIRVAVVAFVTAVLLACGGGGEGGASPRTVVELYGESTMTGYGATTSLPAELQKLRPDLEVIGRGVNSTTASDQLKTWNPQASPARLVVINRGINEPYRGVPPEQFRADLALLVRQARDAGKHVILQTPNPVTGELAAGVQTSAQVVREVASAMNVPLSDANAIPNAASLLVDPLHPSNALIGLMASDLARLIPTERSK